MLIARTSLAFAAVSNVRTHSSSFFTLSGIASLGVCQMSIAPRCWIARSFGTVEIGRSPAVGSLKISNRQGPAGRQHVLPP